MNRPLRIHFFVQFVHEQGTYFRFHNLAQGLQTMGHRVKVFGCDHDGSTHARTEMRDGIEYQIFPTLPLKRYFVPINHPGNALRNLPNARHRCDVAHLFQPFALGALAWRFARARLHAFDWDDLWIGGMMPSPGSSFLSRYNYHATRKLERCLPAKADLVTTCSRYLAKLAGARTAKAVSVIHNGIWKANGQVDRLKARQSLGLDPNAFYIGFMGRTVQELSWCFELLAHLGEQFPRLRLALCGPPASVLDGLHPSIKQKIDYLGNLPSAKTVTFAEALDLGLLPLERNSFNLSRFPIKFSEYLAAGTPVLCSAVGECARLAKQLPGVFLAGSTQEEWICSAYACLRKIELFKVDPEKLLALFHWENLAKKISSAYIENLKVKGT